MTSIIWNDKYNEDYTGEVTVSPSSGNGNARVSISGSPNEGLDRSGTMTASGSGTSREMSVVNEGRRHVFMTGDGLPFRTSDGSTYNTIKKTDIGVRGVIGLYSGKGLDNKRMAANPVWRDESGLENHLQMKNFLWKLGSGCGSYSFDFTRWIFNYVDYTRSSSKINLTRMNSGYGAIVLNTSFTAALESEISFTIELSGLKDISGYFSVYCLLNGEDHLIKEQLKNGHYTLLIPKAATSVFFRLYGYNKEDCNITIEQIPDYSGAIVFDGVDDYGICETFPILTKEKGYTVMALRKYIGTPSKGYLVANGSSILESSFIMEGNSLKDTWNFGASANITDIVPPLISYQTSKHYNSKQLTAGPSKGNNLLYVEGYGNFYNSVALYSLVIIDHDTTEEERQLVIDYWKKEFPELQITQS